MNSKRVGNIAEAAVIAALVSHGWAVLLPFGDVEAYDLVVDRGLGFERVQVKTGRFKNGCIEFNGYTIGGRGATQTTRTYAGKIELFAVFYPPTKGVYLVPIGDITSSKPLLRIDPPAHSYPTIRWAKQYLL